MKLLGISGTIVGAKTAVLVGRILDEVKTRYPCVEVELLDLGIISLNSAMEECRMSTTTTPGWWLKK